MEKSTSGVENRTSLVKEAKALGITVLKKDSVAEIKKQIEERISKPGITGMEALTPKQVTQADAVRAQLYVVERVEDSCFGVLFDSKSEACSQRCAVNQQCVVQLLKNADLLLADEKARAKEEAAFKGPGRFKPLPLLAYVQKPKTETPAAKIGEITAKSKVKWLLTAEQAQEVDAQWQVLVEVITDMQSDIKTFADLQEACVAVEAESKKKFLGKDKTAGCLKLAKEWRKLGWATIGGQS